ncbi:MAG: GNAT family N-acetyltransferase [Thermoplasmata archaeon]
MDVSLVPFDPRQASREEWARFHVFRRLRHEEENPGDPLTDDSTDETWMRRGDPEAEEIRFAAIQSGEPEEVIGWLYFSVYREGSPTYATREKEARVSVQVLQPYRRRGVGRMLLAKAAELARERGKSLVIGGTQEADGFAFVEAIGAQVGQRNRESRLHMDRVDWEMVERWAEEGPRRSPRTTLQWLGDHVPDDIVEEYCEVLTESLNEAPRDELETGDMAITPEVNRYWEDNIKESGGRGLDVIGREGDGAISGITAMGYWPDQKTMIHQFITGVRPPYRGRGLGKWLKAANLLRVRRELPQVAVVVTGNATTNAAMLAINERLGFRKHREGIMAQMSLEALEEYLNGRRSHE